MENKRDAGLENRISYLRIPPAKDSIICLALSFGSILLGCVGVGVSIYHRGRTPLYGVAICFISLVAAVVSVVFGLSAFREKDKSHRYSKIGLVLSGLTISFWIMLIAVGLGR